jgi:RNA recognition motif-containing protein
VQVIHLRNLPIDVTDEELRALGAPFGQVAAVKGQVGPNRNQGFLEFAAVEQAAAAVSSHQPPNETARVRMQTMNGSSGLFDIANFHPLASSAAVAVCMSDPF